MRRAADLHPAAGNKSFDFVSFFLHLFLILSLNALLAFFHPFTHHTFIDLYFHSVYILCIQLASHASTTGEGKNEVLNCYYSHHHRHQWIMVEKKQKKGMRWHGWKINKEELWRKTIIKYKVVSCRINNFQPRLDNFFRSLSTCLRSDYWI